MYPSFPRGFQLSLSPRQAPKAYVKGPLLPNFFVHPWTTVNVAGDASRFVIVLGSCVSTSSRDDGDSAGVLLAALDKGEDLFLTALDEYCGRHAIIYGDLSAIRIVNDATAMRSVYYATCGGVVASHAILVERALGGDFFRNSLPVKFGYPGNLTPYSRTQILTANTVYDLQANAVRRFWPKHPPLRRTVNEASAELLDRSAMALLNAERKWPLKIALTAGLDSRTLLAVAMHSGIAIDTYTYGQGADTLMDRNLAVELAQSIGVGHTLVPKVSLDRDLRRRLSEVTYSPHHPKAVGELLAWIKNPNTAVVTAHLLETGGRGFRITRTDEGAPTPPPNRAAEMALLQFRTFGRKATGQVATWGERRYFAESGAAFQKFIETCNYQQGDGLIDPFDQFYWEHRMSAWHGPAMNERDFYAEAFIPFNSRAIFEAMLGAPERDRLNGAILYGLIKRVRPKLLDLPVNPKEWPPKSA